MITLPVVCPVASAKAARVVKTLFDPSSKLMPVPFNNFFKASTLVFVRLAVTVDDDEDDVDEDVGVPFTVEFVFTLPMGFTIFAVLLDLLGSTVGLDLGKQLLFALLVDLLSCLGRETLIYF